MNFSNQLIDELKKKLQINTDAEAAELIPEMNKGNLSKIRKGIEGRHLNEKQAIWIAEQCQINLNWVLVHLAEETAKTEKAKSVWNQLAKTMAKSASALAILGFLLVSQVSGHIPPQRARSIR